MRGLFYDLALVSGMQVEELASSKGHAANFVHAQFKAGLVAATMCCNT